MGIIVCKQKQSRIRKRKIKRHVGLSCDESGQMAVELAFAFPILLVVALVAINALIFFSECAAFDVAFREGVRLCCTSPGYGQDGSGAQANLEAYMGVLCNGPNEEIAVSVRPKSWGYKEYIGKLTFRPTVFSHQIRSTVFGVAFPVLTHEIAFTVDSYKPGVVL